MNLQRFSVVCMVLFELLLSIYIYDNIQWHLHLGSSLGYGFELMIALALVVFCCVAAALWSGSAIYLVAAAVLSLLWQHQTLENVAPAMVEGTWRFSWLDVWLIAQMFLPLLGLITALFSSQQFRKLVFATHTIKDEDL